MPVSIQFRRLLLSSVLLLPVGLPVAAQPTRVPLTLQQSVEQALRFNLLLEAEQLSPQAARETVRIAEAQFDPALELAASNTFRQRSLAATQLEGAARPRSETLASRAAISKLLSTTGAVVSLESRLARTETNSELATLNPAYDSEVSLNLRQPLLRGRGEVVRASRDRARIGERLSRHEFTATAMDVVLATELAYFRLAFALEEAELRRFTLQLAESFLEEVRFRSEAGAADALDVLRADVSLADRREALVEAERRVLDRQDDLLNVIGQYQTSTELDLVVVPQPLETIPAPMLEVDDIIRRMRELRPEFLFISHQLEQFELDLRIARNLRLPSLDVGGGVGYTGLDRNVGRSFSDLTERDGHFWRVEATFTMPIGLREERAQLRRAELFLDREIIRLQRFQQDLLVEARASLRAVQTAAERLLLADRFYDAGRRQYEMEEERYRAGVSTSRNVLDAQAEMEEARLREINARVNLHEAQATLRRAMGDTFEPYRELPALAEIPYLQSLLPQ